VSGFVLDTSGAVPMPSAHGGTVAFLWGGLIPFQQGAVEAALRECWAAPMKDANGGKWPVKPGFSDLAPTALARIVEDCERFQQSRWNTHPTADPERQRLQGAAYWKSGGAFGGFPPLDLYLADDGLIHHREQSS